MKVWGYFLLLVVTIYAKTPPVFFLQDPVDGMCLAGDSFKRCGIDTLWYVDGKPGTYTVHKRAIDEINDEIFQLASNESSNLI